MVRLFNSDKHGGGEPHVKVRLDNDNSSHMKTDRYDETDGGKHSHESFRLNTGSGEYKEYHGGKESDDRSYSEAKTGGDKGAHK